MLIYVYGEDQFRATQKVRQLKGYFKKKFDKSGINLSEFSGKINSSEAIGAMKSGGFLSSHRMVVLHELCSGMKAEDFDAWVAALSVTGDDAIVVLRESQSRDKFIKLPLIKALKSIEKHEYEQKTMSMGEIALWLISEARNLGKELSASDARYFLDRVGIDSWRLITELQKVAGFSTSVQISRVDIDEIVESNVEERIFDFIDAVCKKRAKEAIRLLERERNAGASDGYIFHMLIKQLRTLIRMKDLIERTPEISKADAAAQLGVHPFVAQKTQIQVKKFEMDALKRSHDLVFELERKLKQSQVHSDLALEKLVISFLK